MLTWSCIWIIVSAIEIHCDSPAKPHDHSYPFFFYASTILNLDRPTDLIRCGPRHWTKQSCRQRANVPHKPELNDLSEATLLSPQHPPSLVMTPLQVLPLFCVHIVRLSLQGKLSWELTWLVPTIVRTHFYWCYPRTRKYALRCLEFMLAMIYVEGPENAYPLWESFDCATFFIMNILTVVGTVSMSLEAAIDFVSLISYSSELALLFAIVLWLISPNGDALNAILYATSVPFKYVYSKPCSFHLKGVEVIHLTILLVCLVGRVMYLSYVQSTLSSKHILRFLPSTFIREVMKMATSLIEAYGLDGANMSPTTYAGVATDLVFIFGIAWMFLTILRIIFVQCVPRTFFRSCISKSTLYLWLVIRILWVHVLNVKLNGGRRQISNHSVDTPSLNRIVLNPL